MKYVFLKILLALTFLFSPFSLLSQGANNFFKLSSPVKLWVITHPFAACKAASISKEALEMTKWIKNDQRLDGFDNGGQVDAFRHAYWMALLSQSFNCRKAFRLGLAHEKGNIRGFKKGRLEEGEPPDSVSVAMDHYNNCVGVNIGFDYPNLSRQELAEIIITKILEGQLLIIKRNNDGKYLSCDGSVIENSQWKGHWNTSRCLVKSNYHQID